MNNTNQAHPIELAIIALLFLVEGICYIINEIAGFHKTTTTTTATAQQTTATAQTTATPSTISSTQPTNTNKPYIHQMITENQDYIDYVTQLTVKQLRQLTGIKTKSFRKQQLINAAIAY